MSKKIRYLPLWKINDFPGVAGVGYLLKSLMCRILAIFSLYAERKEEENRGIVVIC